MESKSNDTSNYDVLFLADNDSRRIQFAPGHHIGNQRFRVFLNMHRQAFEVAESDFDNEECDRIAGIIVRTVCHECVPRGRFLEKRGTEANERDKEWVDIGDGPMARIRVRQAFDVVPTHLGSHDDQIHSVHNEPGAQNSPRDRHQAPDLQFGGGSEPHECILGNHSSHVPQKRKYLRSTSDTAVTLEKRIRGGMPRTGSHRCTVKYDIRPCDINKNDVLCGGSGMGILSTDNVGNNRFRVLVSIQRDKYAAADRKRKFKIVCDIVNTVKASMPSGRFLIENHNTGLWGELNIQKAWSKTVRTIRFKPDPNLVKMRSAAVKSLMRRKEKVSASTKLDPDQIEELHKNILAKSKDGSCVYGKVPCEPGDSPTTSRNQAA